MSYSAKVKKYSWMRFSAPVYLVLFISSFLFSGAALAQASDDDLVGTWQGKLTITPSSVLSVQFIVTKAEDGTTSSVLNVPDEANLRNIPVSRFHLENNAVTFEVEDVNGVYKGELVKTESDEFALNGSWTQQGVSFPLNLKPFVKRAIPADVAATLLGAWNAVLVIPHSDRRVPIVLNFEQDNLGKFKASIDSPSQAAFGINVDQINYFEDELEVKVFDPEMSFKGMIKDDVLKGKWTQGGSVPLDFYKGDFQFEALDIPQAIIARVEGTWFGDVSGGFTVGFRFKNDEDGKFRAYFDSLDEGRRGIPVSAIDVDGDNIELKIDGFGAKFNGKFKGEKLVGVLQLGDNLTQLELNRGEYVIKQNVVSEEDIKKLSGRWEGIAGSTKLVFRFELDTNGNLVALHDIPSRQLFSLPVTDLVVKENKLNFIVKGLSAEFEGQFEAGKIKGKWVMPELQFPLELSQP